MSLTIWTDEYEVGVESLDTDHIIIFSLVNNVDEAIRLGASKRTIRSMLRVLISLAVDHFNREEFLMKKNGFPDVEAHTAEHHQIVSELHPLIVAYEENPTADINSKIIGVLAAWMNVHVLVSDVRYRPFLENQEVQSRRTAV